jgi:hypothetical protein
MIFLVKSDLTIFMETHPFFEAILCCVPIGLMIGIIIYIYFDLKKYNKKN